jgi:hypothetical protein
MSTTNYVKLGDSVVLPGTHLNILSFLNITLPFPQGLVGLYLFGGSISTSLRNYADNTKPLTVLGTPTVSSFGMTMNATNYFDTGLNTGLDRTWTVVAKPKLAAVTGDRACLITNRRFTGGQFRGDAMQWLETNNLQNYFDMSAASSGSAALSVAGANTSLWNGFAGIVGSDGVAQTGWRKSGATTWRTPTTATTRTLYSGNNLLIGGSLSGETGSSDIGLVILQNAVLTQAQVDANMTYLSNLLSTSYGITPF